MLAAGVHVIGAGGPSVYCLSGASLLRQDFFASFFHRLEKMKKTDKVEKYSSVTS